MMSHKATTMDDRKMLVSTEAIMFIRIKFLVDLLRLLIHLLA